MANAPAKTTLVDNSHLYELFRVLSASVAPCLNVSIDSDLKIRSVTGGCWAVFGVNEVGLHADQGPMTPYLLCLLAKHADRNTSLHKDFVRD